MTGLTRQIGVQALGAGFCAAVSFLLLMWLGRVLGAAEFGHYIFLLNLATLGLVLIEGGWPTFLCRNGAQGAGKCSNTESAGCVERWMGAAFFHILLVAGVMSAVAVRSSWGGELAMALLCMGCVAGMNLVSARLRSELKFKLEAGWQSLGRLVSAIAIVCLVESYDGESGLIFLAWGAGLLLVLGFGGRAWLRWPRAGHWCEGMLKTWPFMLITALSIWLLKGDVVVLGTIGDSKAFPNQELSWYAACTRLSEAMLLLGAPIGNVLLVRFSRKVGLDLNLKNRASVYREAVFFVVILFICGGLVVASAWAFGSALMQLLFGAEFAEAGVLLPWVLLMLPFALSNIVLFALLTSLGKERNLVFYMVLAGLALLGLSVALGTNFGAYGVAKAMAIAHALVFGLSWMTLLKEMQPANH